MNGGETIINRINADGDAAVAAIKAEADKANAAVLAEAEKEAQRRARRQDGAKVRPVQNGFQKPL